MYTLLNLHEEVKKAYKRIRPYILKTPFEKSLTLSNNKRCVYLKLECVQRTRSFKLRGATNKILSLSEEERKKGIVGISSGNHGVAVSYIGHQLGIEKTLIFVPSVTPKEKTGKIIDFGGRLEILGHDYDACHTKGMDYVNDHGMTYVDAYDKDPLVYAGQGTIGLEILEDCPDIDTILVPIGGGGLITGISAAVKVTKPDVKIIGLQTCACPAMVASLEEKVFYDTYPIKDSVCEALVGGVGELAYKLGHEAIDDIIVLEEDHIKEAVRHMVYEEKIVAEPSACLGIAALKHHSDRIGGGHIAVVVSGGNIGKDLLKKLLL